MDIGLAKLPWQGQVGAFVILALAGVGAYTVYYEQPVRADMAARGTELAALRTLINTGLTTARQLPEFRAQVTELEGRLDDLKAVLPDEKDAADLLRRLQLVAMQSHLTIKSFKPAPTITKPLHAEWPISLELDGTYHNLAIFVDRVGKFTRIINISALDVKGKEKPDATSTITATCTATTFVLLDKPAAAVPATPATPNRPALKGA